MKKMLRILCIALALMLLCLSACADEALPYRLLNCMETLQPNRDGSGLEVDETLPAGTPYLLLRAMTPEEAAAFGEEYVEDEYWLISYTSLTSGKNVERWIFRLPTCANPRLGDGYPRMDVMIASDLDDNYETVSVAWYDLSLDENYSDFLPVEEEDEEYVASLISQCSLYAMIDCGIDPQELLRGRADIGKREDDEWQIDLWLNEYFFDTFTFDLDGVMIYNNLSSGGMG